MSGGTNPSKRKTACYTETQLQSALKAVQGMNINSKLQRLFDIYPYAFI